eukprot:GHVH01015146.1.p1 GENE.GHVH01015146.1~~GHVH01015146.1.p1  ORF type:complete len:139 (-),score=13.89 GHVH01015146.1:743-1159(-)
MSTDQTSFPSFVARCNQNPESEEARRFEKLMTGMIRRTNQAIDFWNGQRYALRKTIFAYNETFGLPSHFFTISPSDIDDKFIMRLADWQNTCRRIVLPDCAKRNGLLISDPVAASESFIPQKGCYLWKGGKRVFTAEA